MKASRNEKVQKFSHGDAEKALWLKIGLGSAMLGLTGILICIFLGGCGSADRALSVPVWEEPTAYAETMPQQSEVQEENISERVIYVYVCGAVNDPDVVKLPEGSRAQDALEAAGGFDKDADKEAVNLAGVLSDGQKLYFPAVGETWTDSQSDQMQGTGGVNINTADISGLCSLPGIGESRARAIIEYREQNGRFEQIEDIMKVSGIKEGAFEKIKAHITVR